MSSSEKEPYQEKPVLISSGQTMVSLDPEHTTTYTLRDESEFEFCVETIDPESRQKERVFLDDERVIRVLYDLGYTAVIRSYATEEQLEEYRSGTNESVYYDWDVLDLHDNESYYLKYFIGDKKEEPEIEIQHLNSPEIKMTNNNEEYTLTYDNTMVVIYHKDSQHREFSHIQVCRDGNLSLFYNRGLMKALIDHKYPRMHLPQINDPSLVHRLTEMMSDTFDEEALELFDIAEPDDQ